MGWGLDEDQETVLIKVAQDGIKESLDHLDHGVSIDMNMSEVFSDLEKIS